MTTLDINNAGAVKPAKTRASSDHSTAMFYLLVLALAAVALGASTFAFGLAGLILPVLALVPLSFVMLVLITLG
ncbi:MAG TPA: hypothetical protein ENJ52_05735 [Aliiroseovarius sp.]|nr:hypothetical protein [Aliiroseovarius sp.]